jgi:hypothetical protein
MMEVKSMVADERMVTGLVLYLRAQGMDGSTYRDSVKVAFKPARAPDLAAGIEQYGGVKLPSTLVYDVIANAASRRLVNIYQAPPSGVPMPVPVPVQPFSKGCSARAIYDGNLLVALTKEGAEYCARARG